MTRTRPPILVMLLAFLASPVLYAGFPSPSVETLPNGLTVAWFADSRLPVIDMTIMVKAGSKADRPDKGGTAELLSAVMSRGAGNLDAMEFAKALEALGASYFCSADGDSLSLGVHGLSPDQEALLELLAKMTLEPRLEQSEIEKAKIRIANRLKHISDDAATLASAAFEQISLSGTPYESGRIQSVRELMTIGKDDLVAHYRNYVRPENAVLVVVGKSGDPTFAEKVRSRFGLWKSGGDTAVAQLPLPRPRASSPPASRRSSSITVLNRPGSTQAEIRIGVTSPPPSASMHYPLGVANALLGETFRSRLNTVIREKLGLTYSIESTFIHSQEHSRFLVMSSTAPEKTGQALKEILAILNGFSGSISDDEVAAAKDFRIGRFTLATSSLHNIAAAWLSARLFHLGPDYVSRFTDRISAVSADEVRQTFSRSLEFSNPVVVIAGEEKKIRKSLAKHRFTSIRSMKIHY